jgi:hypothetical protein
MTSDDKNRNFYRMSFAADLVAAPGIAAGGGAGSPLGIRFQAGLVCGGASDGREHGLPHIKTQTDGKGFKIFCDFLGGAALDLV